MSKRSTRGELSPEDQYNHDRMLKFGATVSQWVNLYPFLFLDTIQDDIIAVLLKHKISKTFTTAAKMRLAKVILLIKIMDDAHGTADLITIGLIINVQGVGSGTPLRAVEKIAHTLCSAGIIHGLPRISHERRSVNQGVYLTIEGKKCYSELLKLLKGYVDKVSEGVRDRLMASL